MKTIAIIEDHPMISSGLKTIVGKVWASSEIYLFEKINELENHQKWKNHFDCIIADIHLAEINILERLIHLQIEYSALKIILYTSSQPWELGLNQEQFPFFGFVVKSADLQIIAYCLQSIESENYFFQEDLIWKNPIRTEIDNIIVTKREREILLLIKSGKTNKEIGDVLFLSELTIKSHRQNMMRKFESKNVAELIAKTTHLFH